MIKILLLLLFTIQLQAKTIRVVVIDSGISDRYPVKMCNTGSIDLTNTSLTDHLYHGTKVTNIIQNEVKDSNYCQIHIKIFEPGLTTDWQYIKALEYLLTLKDIDVVNISAGGQGYQWLENRLIKQILNNGTYIFAAAGNEGVDLDAKCDYYPACYKHKRLIIVGNLGKNNKKHPTSNYGETVDLWFQGINPFSNSTGTSFSVAIATGKFIKFLDKKYNKK